MVTPEVHASYIKVADNITATIIIESSHGL